MKIIYNFNVIINGDPIPNCFTDIDLANEARFAVIEANKDVTDVNLVIGDITQIELYESREDCSILNNRDDE